MTNDGISMTRDNQLAKSGISVWLLDSGHWSFVFKKRVDCKPGSVFPPVGGNGDHFSKDPGHPGPQAAYPGSGRAIHAASEAAPSLALHRMGFTKLPRRRGTGGLLPRHFTLTPIKGRYIFCCTFPGVAPGSR